MKYLLDLDMDKCISCGACAVACMDQHDTNLEHGDPALRWVTRLERQQGERVAFLRGRLSNATAVQTGFGGDICPRV